MLPAFMVLFSDETGIDLIILLSLGYFKSKNLIGIELYNFKNSVDSLSIKVKNKTQIFPCLKMNPKIENLKLLSF